MPKIDCRYEISEERIRAYLALPEIERLRWLEELIAFTHMFRNAPEAQAQPTGSSRSSVVPAKGA